MMTSRPRQIIAALALAVALVPSQVGAQDALGMRIVNDLCDDIELDLDALQANNALWPLKRMNTADAEPYEATLQGIIYATINDYAEALSTPDTPYWLFLEEPYNVQGHQRSDIAYVGETDNIIQHVGAIEIKNSLVLDEVEDDIAQLAEQMGAGGLHGGINIGYGFAIYVVPSNLAQNWADQLNVTIAIEANANNVNPNNIMLVPILRNHGEQPVTYDCPN